MKGKFLDFGKEVLASVEKLSTCYKTHVGAVLFKDTRIIAIGYNGTPAGWEHCKDKHDLHLTYDVHAEANVIAFCAKHGIQTNETIMFVSKSPCRECAKLIVQAGITTVWIKEVYENDIIGLEILARSGIDYYIFGEK